jgi:hypothetical protein
VTAAGPYHHKELTMNTQTQTYRETAIAVGILFVIATVAALLSTALTSALDAQNYLTRVAAQGDQVIAAALLLIAGGISAVLIAALLFPVLKRSGEGIALGYLGVRILEAVTLFVDVVALLLLVTLGRDSVHAGVHAAADVTMLGALLQAAHHWAFPLNPVVSGLGALLLYSLLYRSRLVPRWLSVWGLAAAALVFAFGLLRMYGGGSLVLALPIGVQEMVLAGWLIAKGFSTPESRLVAERRSAAPALSPVGSRP